MQAHTRILDAVRCGIIVVPARLLLLARSLPARVWRGVLPRMRRRLLECRGARRAQLHSVPRGQDFTLQHQHVC